MVTVADVVEYMNGLYPENSAEPWDAVGLTVGEANAHVSSVLFAVDIDPNVVTEAISSGVELLITHHPLYLSGTTTVAATSAKGRMVHDLIRNGIALYTAHTNADIAPHGVNDALAQLFGLQSVQPLVLSSTPNSHPDSGIGRVGQLLHPTTLEGFVQLVKKNLPATPHGIRVQGDMNRSISRVAVCGGAGDSYLQAAAQANACVYLTSDLRHHRALESSYEPQAPALVDVAHFASEWPWLPHLATLVNQNLGLKTHISRLVTDPWTTHVDPIAKGGV